MAGRPEETPAGAIYENIRNSARIIADHSRCDPTAEGEREGRRRETRRPWRDRLNFDGRSIMHSIENALYTGRGRRRGTEETAFSQLELAVHSRNSAALEFRSERRRSATRIGFR